MNASGIWARSSRSMPDTRPCTMFSMLPMTMKGLKNRSRSNGFWSPTGRERGMRVCPNLVGKPGGKDSWMLICFRGWLTNWLIDWLILDIQLPVNREGRIRMIKELKRTKGSTERLLSRRKKKKKTTRQNANFQGNPLFQSPKQYKNKHVT